MTSPLPGRLVLIRLLCLRLEPFEDVDGRFLKSRRDRNTRDTIGKSFFDGMLDLEVAPANSPQIVSVESRNLDDKLGGRGPVIRQLYDLVGRADLAYFPCSIVCSHRNRYG